MNNIINPDPTILFIFGGSGDLTTTTFFPSDNTPVVGAQCVHIYLVFLSTSFRLTLSAVRSRYPVVHSTYLRSPNPLTTLRSIATSASFAVPASIGGRLEQGFIQRRSFFNLIKKFEIIE